jgi:hypothetical protein
MIILQTCSFNFFDNFCRHVSKYGFKDHKRTSVIFFPVLFIRNKSEFCLVHFIRNFDHIQMFLMFKNINLDSGIEYPNGVRVSPLYLFQHKFGLHFNIFLLKKEVKGPKIILFQRYFFKYRKEIEKIVCLILKLRIKNKHMNVI